WLKAKPEWAKGSRLIRFTPRYNPDVNGFWMCDIGLFGYHWIESDDRLRRPLMRGADGVQHAAAWHDVMPRIAELLTAAGMANADGVRMLLSAHASHEELFLFRRLSEVLPGANGSQSITVSWRLAPKSQPPNTKFKV